MTSAQANANKLDQFEEITIGDFVIFHNGCGEIFVKGKDSEGETPEIRLTNNHRGSFRISLSGRRESYFRPAELGELGLAVHFIPKG